MDFVGAIRCLHHDGAMVAGRRSGVHTHPDRSPPSRPATTRPSGIGPTASPTTPHARPRRHREQKFFAMQVYSAATRNGGSIL